MSSGTHPGSQLGLIVISHGHEALLPSCLGAALAACPDGTETVIVDNLPRTSDLPGGTRDPELPEGVRIIENATPLGFAANANRGAGAVAAPFLLVLNPDVRVTGGRIAELIAFLRAHPRVGCVGARLLDPDGTIQPSARAFPEPLLLVLRALGVDRRAGGSGHVRRSMDRVRDVGRPEPFDWVTGAFMLLRRSAFEEVGGFDERYRLYYEDVDLCHRLRLAGHETWYHPGVTAEHDHARASARSPFQRVFLWHLMGAARFFVRHARARLRRPSGAAPLRPGQARASTARAEDASERAVAQPSGPSR